MLAIKAAASLVVVLTGVLTVHGQFVKPPTDLVGKKGAAGINVRYKEVPPAICETTPGVKSYSGYADLAEDQHMYWWFFERRNAPEDAPLTIWLNGGPGSSSLRGLLQEFGPCIIDANVTLRYNQFSWTNASNILFIDQPITAGLSYTKPIPGVVNDEFSSSPYELPKPECPVDINVTDCGTFSDRNVLNTANETDVAAPYVWKAVQGFAGAFPQYVKNGFHIATESYGGHYGPYFAKYFHEQDKRNIEGAVKLNLKSLLIGNGAMDPSILYESYYKYFVTPGNPYVKDALNKSMQDLVYQGVYGKDNCLDQFKRCKDTDRDDSCSYAFDYCYDNVFYPAVDITGLDVYDVRQTSDDELPSEDFIKYLNTPELQTALGAYTNYSSTSRFVQRLFANRGDDARDFDVFGSLLYLLKEGVTVTLWAGDADYICNYLGNFDVAKKIGYDGFDQAGFTALQTDDKIQHGEVAQSHLLTFARIFEAGHLIPSFQPEASLAVFERTIMGLDIATGKTKPDASFKTQGSKDMRPPQPTMTVADVKKQAADKKKKPPVVRGKSRRSIGGARR